jgi:hypothetical protein
MGARSLRTFAFLSAALLWACAPGGASVDAGPSDAGEAAPEELAWRAVEGSPLANRWGFAATTIGDGRTLVVGGSEVGEFEGALHDDVWVVDATTRDVTFTELETTDPPPKRYCGCAAWDPSRDQVLLYGGRDLDPLFRDAHLLDLGSNTWTEVTAPADGPTASIGCALTYSESAGAYFLLGGGTPTRANEEMWRFDPAGGSWTQVSYENGPAARTDHAFRALDGGDELLVYGGFAPSPIGGQFFADAWRYDVTAGTWSEVEYTTQAAPGRRVPWLRMEPDERAFITGFGTSGHTEDDLLADLWRFDLDDGTWEELAPTGAAPTGRGFTQPVAGAGDVVGVLLGGYNNANPVGDAWLLEGPPPPWR